MLSQKIHLTYGNFYSKIRSLSTDFQNLKGVRNLLLLPFPDSASGCGKASTLHTAGLAIDQTIERTEKRRREQKQSSSLINDYRKSKVSSEIREGALGAVLPDTYTHLVKGSTSSLIGQRPFRPVASLLLPEHQLIFVPSCS